MPSIRYTGARTGNDAIFVLGLGTIGRGQVVAIEDEATAKAWTTPIDTGRVHPRDPDAQKKASLVEEATDAGLAPEEAEKKTKVQLAEWLDENQPRTLVAADFEEAPDEEAPSEPIVLTVVNPAPEPGEVPVAPAEAPEGAGEEVRPDGN